VGRNPERTREVARMTEGIPFICDFDDLDAVRELGDTLGKRFDRIDAVVNNAGGIVATRQESSQGHELTLQRNVLASVVLTERLIPTLLNTRGRVIHTTSMVARLGRIDLDDLGFRQRRYGAGWWPYASAKLGVIMYARSLAMRTGLESYPVQVTQRKTDSGHDRMDADFGRSGCRPPGAFGGHPRAWGGQWNLLRWSHS